MSDHRTPFWLSPRKVGILFIVLLTAGIVSGDAFVQRMLALAAVGLVLYAVFVAIPLYAVRLRRWNKIEGRRQRGQCLACGYDLTGNQSGRCPECGEDA